MSRLAFRFTKELQMDPSDRPSPAALRQAALAYASRGWQVLPLWWPAAPSGCACGLPDCADIGKHPVHSLVPHGLLDATSRPDTITAWWRSFPCANVGIRTGADSGIVVLDVDGAAGRQTLQDLIASHTPFSPGWARTGNGRHAYLQYPGTAVPNSASRIGPGLDVRGDGGYVVAPPSLHRSGRVYRWIDRRTGSTTELGRWPLPPLPDWLLALALPAHPAHSGQILVPAAECGSYAAAALAREAGEVAQARPGQRNDRLNRAAFKLGQLVGAGLLDEATAAEALITAGLAAGPGERKIRSTVRRGLLAGIRSPRHIVIRPST